MGDFKMPSIGADMDAGTLIEWHVKPGERVKRGDVVAAVETDKGIVEVEIWEDGIVESLRIAPGTKVPVGAVLATIRADDAPALAERDEALTAAKPKTTTSVSAAERPLAPPSAPQAPRPAEARPDRVRASPAARQLARERGVDLARVRGSGPHDSISRADVERAQAVTVETSFARATPTTASPSPNAVAPKPAELDASGMRRAIAAAMARSKREIPHYYLAADLDVRAATHWLEAENRARSVTDRILFASLLLKATALAAKAVPEVNGSFVDGAFQPATAVHLGVAISMRQGGLIAPALHDADAKSLTDVQSSLRDLVLRVRSGRLRSSEMSEATLTVTNLGDQGVESVFGVINPPQVAIVGFGRVAERPWAEDGMVGVRPVVTVTLAADHRVSDGHRGALFLTAIQRLLEHPEDL